MSPKWLDRFLWWSGLKKKPKVNKPLDPLLISTIDLQIETLHVKYNYPDRRWYVKELERVATKGGHTVVDGSLRIEQNRDDFNPKHRGRFSAGWHASIRVILDGQEYKLGTHYAIPDPRSHYLTIAKLDEEEWRKSFLTYEGDVV